MSFKVNDRVKFKEPFHLYGDVPSMNISLMKGHRAQIVGIDEKGEYDVKVSEGLVIHNVDGKHLELDNSTDAAADRIESVAKGFHDAHPAADAMKGIPRVSGWGYIEEE